MATATLAHRIKLYLFGLLIGLAFVFFLFRDRWGNGTKEEKVFRELREDELVLGKGVSDSLKQWGVSRDGLDSLLQKGQLFLPKRKDGPDQAYYIEWTAPLDRQRFRAELKVLDAGRTRIEKVKRIRD